MKKLTMHGLLVTAMALAAPGAATASDEQGCTLNSLRGRYVFTARGFTIVSGVAQPKAIVEVIDFDGDGGVSVPWVTVSLNGSILRSRPGADGRYTLDEACTGTIEFFDRNSIMFDLVASPRGNEIWMIQTNPGTVISNPSNVFQGKANRILRAQDQDRQ